MDIMEKYRIKESIKDAIVILDSAPMHYDLSPDTNAVRLTNRAPIAHLAIERGLKSLINESGGCADQIHDLNKLYGDLSGLNKSASEYLAGAFDDAVSFFGYNVKVKGLKHFGSINEYLSKVGTRRSFKIFRYWAIGESADGESPIDYISLTIHRELLCALWILFSTGRRRTVSGRVENIISRAMFDGRRLDHNANDSSKKDAIDSYETWLFTENCSWMGALRKAVAQNFKIIESEFVENMLRDIYKNLQQSNDPAVRYYVHTLTYLPRGSQRRLPDARPRMEWYGSGHIRGMVKSAGGTWLGFIEKRADGSWSIDPVHDDPAYRIEIALALADAKNRLVDLSTRRATCVVNGEKRRLRICIHERSFAKANLGVLGSTDADRIAGNDVYELEFWNDEHGLASSDEIALGVVWDDGEQWASVLKGSIVKVLGAKVVVAGSDMWTSASRIEDWLSRFTKD